MQNRPENVVVKKTEEFADRIVKMCKYLSGQYAQSRADFFTKLTIALKEANETKYWLSRLYAAEHLSETEYESIVNDNVEIIKLLTSITKTVKRNQQE